MPEAREILARNLNLLMERTPDLDSRAKIAKRARVALGAVSYMASTDPTKSSTGIANLEKVANAFGLSAWQMLHPSLGITDRESKFYAKMREILKEELADEFASFAIKETAQ